MFMHFFYLFIWRIGGGGWDEEQPRVDLNYNLNSLFKIKDEKKDFILSFCLKSVHLSLYLRAEDFVTNIY